VRHIEESSSFAFPTTQRYTTEIDSESTAFISLPVVEGEEERAIRLKDHP